MLRFDPVLARFHAPALSPYDIKIPDVSLYGAFVKAVDAHRAGKHTRRHEIRRRRRIAFNVIGARTLVALLLGHGKLCITLTFRANAELFHHAQRHVDIGAADGLVGQSYRHAEPR